MKENRRRNNYEQDEYGSVDRGCAGGACKEGSSVLSFPSIQLMNCTVRDLISDSDMQARGMKLVADRTNAAASCQPDGSVS